MADNTEGAVVNRGHDEGIEMLVFLLEKFELPEGLLPLANVLEVGFVENTGYMWIVQQRKVEHEFRLISQLVRYETEISGYLEKKKIKQLTGVQAKELMSWPPVSEITIDDKQPPTIQFNSGDETKTFPFEAFAAGQ